MRMAIFSTGVWHIGHHLFRHVLRDSAATVSTTVPLTCETLTSLVECCWAHPVWRWCAVVRGLWGTHSLPVKPGTGVLWVLTGIYLCDAPIQAG